MSALKEKIEKYCLAHGIEIPIGFHRRKPSHLAVVLLDETKQAGKLVARTWFKASDVLYYLDSRNDQAPYRTLDFKRMCELKRVGNKLEKLADLSL